MGEAQEVYPQTCPPWRINADEEKKEFRDEFFELAIDDFRLNLEKMRKLYPVKTICMHGSPLSKYDNKKIWERFDYRDYGIIAEPYFDIDFDEVFYLTDTGRSWNNSKASIRDKVEGTEVGGHPGEMRCAVTSSISLGKDVGDLRIRHTWDIIEAVEKGLLPDKIMLNTHPQRWGKDRCRRSEVRDQGLKNTIYMGYY